MRVLRKVRFYDVVGPVGNHVILKTRTVLTREQRKLLESYMRSGYCIGGVGAECKDAVTGETFFSEVGYATDGDYVWELETVRYVQRYGYSPLSLDFLQKALINFGVCLPLSTKDENYVKKVFTRNF